MKKFKKIFAVLLTLAMVLGMGMTSFAAIEGGSIKITGLSRQGNQKVFVYPIYTLNNANNEWKVSDWATGIVTKDTPVADLEDSSKLEALKAKALAAQGVTEPSTQSTTGEATISGLEAGAYFVYVQDTTNKVEYNPMVAITFDYNENNLMIGKQADLVAKAGDYTVDKKQDGSSNNKMVEVGDLIEYEITQTVPYYDGPTTFEITDSLTGAHFYLQGDAVKGKDAVSEVTINGMTSFNEGAVRVPQLGESVNGTKEFTLDLSSFVTKDNTYAGMEVKIRYTAAVEAVDTVTNKATSTQDPTGTTTTAKTGSMEILKYGEGNEANVLSGAEFAVYRMNGNVKEYAYIDDNGFVTGQWSATYTDTGMKVTTGPDGKAKVQGLGAGTFYFEEKKAPDGYSINNTDYPDATLSLDNPTVDNLKMNDTKLANLPGTGGIGTTIFTIGGCAIMIIAAALFFASRRKSAK